MSDFLRVYFDPDEIGLDGYPIAWHRSGAQVLVEDAEPLVGREKVNAALLALGPLRMSIKDYVREQAGHRCERCGHPYMKGNPLNSPRSEWTPCDRQCAHKGPARIGHPHGGHFDPFDLRDTDVLYEGTCGELVELHEETTEARWRILTVHHLNGVKHDCRWWNLAALCQRCHLAIQGRVVMERVWPWEHSDWFKPHAAGWYAAAYLGEELSREETMTRLDELLDLERQV